MLEKGAAGPVGAPEPALTRPPEPFHDGRPKVAAWWSAVQERDAVKKVLGEMQSALVDYQKGIMR